MRKKWMRFQQNRSNPLFVESGKTLFDTIKGRWHPAFFKQTHPIVLELGCGTGEYAVTLAKQEKEKNFIGIDIKGSRMWVGAEESQRQQLTNIAFLRTRIELLDRFFVPGEVEEIFITFPDPRPKEREGKKRLTSERFLSIYERILREGGRIHLKTDHLALYQFTLHQIAKHSHYVVRMQTDDLYRAYPDSMHTEMQTVYEKRFLAEGKPIRYLCFEMGRWGK